MLPTGCLMIIKNSIPWPMLVIPFVTRNGSNKHFAKTNRPPACCLQNCPGGPSFLGLAPVRNAPTRIGSGQSTNCGSTSATASRRRPANAIMTRKLLAKNKRPLTANASSMSLPPTNTRRLPSRRLHAISAFSKRRLLVALWPNTLHLHNRWRQPKPSSCGFAAAASMSGLPTRLRGNSNARPLSHICDMSRTAACMQRLQRSSGNRQLQREQRLWPQG
jgi:hypothetical protein